jgi:hypothetical protein
LLFEFGLELALDVVDLLIVAEEHRELEDPDRGNDLAQADAGEGRGMDLADPHLAEHVALVAADAAGVNLERQTAAALGLQILAHRLHFLDPGRAFGGQNRELDLMLGNGLSGTGAERESQDGEA